MTEVTKYIFLCSDQPRRKYLLLLIPMKIHIGEAIGSVIVEHIHTNKYLMAVSGQTWLTPRAGAGGVCRVCSVKVRDHLLEERVRPVSC